MENQAWAHLSFGSSPTATEKAASSASRKKEEVWILIFLYQLFLMNDHHRISVDVQIPREAEAKANADLIQGYCWPIYLV